MALFIHFYSLLLYILTIFKVAYVKSQCNGSPLSVTVNEMTGSFKYPPSGEYSPNLQCEWLIVAPDGQKILYKLHDVGINVGTNPCTDGISVYDGDSTSANAVETNACTTNNIFSSPIRLSSTSKVFLRFTSDGTASPGNDLGFTFLAISAAEQSLCSTTGSTVNLNATTTQQYFTSPNFPNEYPRSHTCEWIISPSDQGANVTVEFRYVDVEVKGGSSPGCYDKLIITYGDSHSETVEFCGNEDYSPNRIFDNGGSGDNITISFTSDSAQTERGFVVTYIQSEVLATTTQFETTTTTTTTTEAPTTTTTTEAPTTTTTTEDPTTTTTTEALTTTTTTEDPTTTTTTEAPTTTTTTEASTTPTTTEALTIITTTEAPTATTATEAPTTTMTTEAPTTTTTTKVPTTTTTTEAPSTTTTTETPTSSTTTEAPTTTTTTTEAPTTTTTMESPTTTTTTEAPTTTTITEASTTTSTEALSTTTTTNPPIMNTVEPLLDEEKAIPIVSGVTAGVVLIFICVSVILIYYVLRKSRNKKKPPSRDTNSSRYVSNMTPYEDNTYSYYHVQDFPRSEKQIPIMNDTRRNYRYSKDANRLRTFETSKHINPRVHNHVNKYSHAYEHNWNNDYIYYP